ncbi:MAG: nitrate/nitrite transporter [Saprospiraceae bacterium]
MKIPNHILPTIVLAQFLCTSLWFAGNAVMSDLVQQFALPTTALGHLTAVVQFGFIIGTLLFAILTIADRYSPSKVFLICAWLGAISNLGTIWEGNSLTSLLFFRFMTGFCLAGIYPVGMKIAADYFDKGLGKSLGFLVGALVLGTAFPHLLKGFSAELPWRNVLIATSTLAAIGGTLLWFFVKDGPFRKASKGFDVTAIFRVFKKRPFRGAAFGYFGHMWELYAFWTFVPLLLQTHNTLTNNNLSVSLWSFIIIGIGGLGCVVGGYLAQVLGTRTVAISALTISGLCCLVSPFAFGLPTFGFLGFLLIWGVSVVADSPLFSTLVAQNAPVAIKGTALTIVNSIGFFITIWSIQLLNNWTLTTYIFLILAVGPLFGLVSLYRLGK